MTMSQRSQGVLNAGGDLVEGKSRTLRKLPNIALGITPRPEKYFTPHNQWLVVDIYHLGNIHN